MIITESLVQILAYLHQQQGNKVYSSIIAKKTDKTYSHVTKLVNDLHRKGFVERERKGRRVMLKLTNKGLKVAENCNSLINDLKR